MKENKSNIILGIFTLFICILITWDSYQPKYNESGLFSYGVSLTFFPLVIVSIMAVLDTILIITGIFKANREHASKQNWPLVLKLVSILFAYILCLPFLGFIISSIIFCLLIIPILGYRNKKIVLLVSILSSLMIWYAFKLLQISMPESALLNSIWG